MREKLPQNTSLRYFKRVFHSLNYKNFLTLTQRSCENRAWKILGMGNKKEVPFEQTLTAFAFLHLGMCPRDLDDMLLHYVATREETTAKILFTRYLEDKKLIEVKYDARDYPEQYRLHTKGIFAYDSWGCYLGLSPLDSEMRADLENEGTTRTRPLEEKASAEPFIFFSRDRKPCSEPGVAIEYAKEDHRIRLQVLEAEVEKGDFVYYKEIARWLKKNV